MCIIIAKSEGVALPSLDTLKICNTNNDDGCGLAYHKKGGDKVHIKKDFLTVEDMWDYITENITVDDSAIIHFRLATSGLVDFGNRHPFPLSNEDEKLRSPELSTKIAVAHNGVFSRWNNEKGDLSDTQLFIKNVLSDKLIRDNLKGNLAIQTLLSDFIGGSKLAILDNTGHLSVWGHFHKDDGLYYSNQSYQTVRITYFNFDAWNEYKQMEIGYRGQEDNPSPVVGEICSSCYEDTSTTVIAIDNELWPLCTECEAQYKMTYPECACGDLTDNNDGVCFRCRELQYTDTDF